ncbi:MAG: class I SAM-dependent methyltransferase [Planctomycetaceae bacterium]|nr:class I SAM-dependent methyltransferase [Planctomycetaceae bacterium]
MKIKTEGLSGLFKSACRQLLTPRRLKYFPRCRALFHSRSGLEIGGPSEIFGSQGEIPVYAIAARIDNCNFSGQTIWEGSISEGQTFSFNSNKQPGRQYLVEAGDLQGIEDDTYDFVLSSHCLEHLANPLQGLSEWIRVLKPGGTIVLVVPHKEGTFDHRRPVTTLEHMIEDLDNHVSEADLTHLDEILKLHDLSRDPGAGDFQSFQERSKQNLQNRCLHHHVFETRLAVEVVNYMKLQILTVEFLPPYHIVVIARKPTTSQVVNNDQLLGE